MPVSINELRERQRPLADRIYEFLSRNRGQAYSFSELIQAVEGYGDAFAVLTAALLDKELQGKYRAALSQLLIGGKIDAANIRGGFYYAAK